VDPSNSIKWYSKAAEQGFPDAELALSSWYLSGSHGVLQQSDSDAYLWARKAGDRGHAKAEYQVGNYFEIGIGVEASSEEAKRWYGRAAGKGHKRASQRLSELKKAGKKQAGRCIVA
jgi:TPR repeat protein